MITGQNKEGKIRNKYIGITNRPSDLAHQVEDVDEYCVRMQNAHAYEDVNKHCDRYREIATFLQDHAHLFQWQPEEVILDAGCGPGDITATVLQQWLPANFRALVGVDVSQKMIKHAQRRYNNGRLAFFTADVSSDVTNILNNEKYSDGFHKVFSFCVLHWLSDLERGVRNIHTLLRPGGQALLTFPVDRYFQKTFRAVRKSKKWSSYFKFVDRELPPFPRTSDPAGEFQEMMTSAGFHVVQCDVRDRHSEYGSVDDIKGLIESLDQDCDCIPVEMKEQFLDDCLQIMDDMGAVNQENSSVKQIMLTCVAVKR